MNLGGDGQFQATPLAQGMDGLGRLDPLGHIVDSRQHLVQSLTPANGQSDPTIAAQIAL